MHVRRDYASGLITDINISDNIPVICGNRIDLRDSEKSFNEGVTLGKQRIPYGFLSARNALRKVTSQKITVLRRFGT